MGRIVSKVVSDAARKGHLETFPCKHSRLCYDPAAARACCLNCGKSFTAEEVKRRGRS